METSEAYSNTKLFGTPSGAALLTGTIAGVFTGLIAILNVWQRIINLSGTQIGYQYIPFIITLIVFVFSLWTNFIFLSTAAIAMRRPRLLLSGLLWAWLISALAGLMTYFLSAYVSPRPALVTWFSIIQTVIVSTLLALALSRLYGLRSTPPLAFLATSAASLLATIASKLLLFLLSPSNGIENSIDTYRSAEYQTPMLMIVFIGQILRILLPTLVIERALNRQKLAARTETSQRIEPLEQSRV